MRAPDLPLDHQLQVVKDLYAELFMLMVQSVQEDPDSAHAAGLDRTIEQLMLTVDTSMKDFVGAVRSGRAAQAIPADLNGNIIQFEASLEQGLRTMHEKVRGRVTQLHAEREDLKSRLQLVQRKRRGAKGYRHGRDARTVFMDSEV